MPAFGKGCGFCVAWRGNGLKLAEVHPEVVHVPVAPDQEAVKICYWIHEFLSLQEELPFSGDQMDFGPAHPSLFLLYTPSLALPSHLSVLCNPGALCWVTLVLLQSLPVVGTGWHSDGAHSAMNSLAGFDYSRQLEGPAHLPAPSVSCFNAGFQSSGAGHSCCCSDTCAMAWSKLQWQPPTALHNQIAVGNLSFSLVSSSDFFCVQGIYLETWWFCWVTTCVQLFPAWVCEGHITSLLDKQDGEGMNSAWHVAVPAVGYELAEPGVVSWRVLHPSTERCTKNADHNVAEASGGCSVFTFTTTGTKHSNALLPVHTSDCAGALVNDTTMVPV